MSTHISTTVARRFAAAVSAAGIAVLLAACGPTTTGATTVPSRSPVATTASPSPSAVLPPSPTATPTPTRTPTPSRSATPTHRAEPSPTPRRTTAKPVPAPTHRVTKKPAPAPSKAATTCEIVSAAGNCYKAGQFCRNADVGKETHDAAGRLLRCAVKSGKPHWGYV